MSALRSPALGLVLVAVLAALALVGVSARGWWGADRASAQLDEGQAQVFQSLLRAAGPHDQSSLELLLQEQHEQGLRYLRVDTPRGPLEAGESIGVGTELGSERVQGRLRVVARSPPPRGAGGRPPPPLKGGPPVVVLEFVPVGSLALRNRATLTLGLSAVLGVVLVVASLLIYKRLASLSAAEAEVERSRHLASIGEMSAVLAHELRNPLASLKGHAQLLEELLEGPLQRKASRVVMEAQRLETLSNTLLEFARCAEIQRALVSPAALLQEAAAQLDGAVSLSLEQAPERWALDARLMRQVLANLLDNALQAAPDPVASVCVERGELLFQVVDSGTGISAQMLGVLFEPFQTDRARGTGLGLAFARQVVTLHGGRIEADNLPAGGARLRVWIPEA